MTLGHQRPALTPELATALQANPAFGVEDQNLPIKLNTAIREGFAVMSLPPQMSSLGQLMADAAAKFARITDPAQKELARREVRHQVQSALGDQATKEAYSTLALWSARNPGLVHALTEADYLSDVRVIGSLANAARLRKARGQL